MRASFRAVLQEIARGGGGGSAGFVCVTEDDAEFSAEFSRLLDERLLNRLPRFDVLRLHTYENRTRGYATINASAEEFLFFAPVKPWHAATAQVFTNSGAAKILAAMHPLRAPFDNLIYRDVFIPGLRVLEIRPPVVVSRRVESTIGARASGRRTINSVLNRKIFLLSRNIRSVVSFIRAWGFLSIFRLRYYR